MQELTEAFLLLARESDQALSKDHVCVNDVIDEEITRVQLLAEEKGLVINFKAEYNLYVDASDKVLSVMLGNLLRNAILYTDEGSVNITVASGSVIISDSGRGISPQQVDEIFKPYYRANNSSAPGHGVGMTIVKRLSDRFDWPIKINSTPGQGTRVEVQFPVSDSQPG
jgi:signal transduction histidine kinase